MVIVSFELLNIIYTRQPTSLLTTVIIITIIMQSGGEKINKNRENNIRRLKGRKKTTHSIARARPRNAHIINKRREKKNRQKRESFIRARRKRDAY